MPQRQRQNGMPMNLTPIAEIAARYGCELLYNEPMQGYTTMRIGGACDAMLQPNSSECVAGALAALHTHGIPYHVIGKGSNVLISDEGLRGVVLLMGGTFSRITLVDSTTLECEAGASLAAVCKFACEHSLTGLEFAWGIPGTVGGAAVMNAGAYGGEMSGVVLSCEMATPAGELVDVSREELRYSYRHSVFSDSDCIVTKVRFSLAKGDRAQIQAQMDCLLQRRQEKQPLQYPSAGSTFKRPDGSYASLLIEQCGLKGFTVGGAQVSELHSGFVINKSNATFEDVMALIDIIKARVEQQTGYRLECEVLVLRD